MPERILKCPMRFGHGDDDCIKKDCAWYIVSSACIEGDGYCAIWNIGVEIEPREE